MRCEEAFNPRLVPPRKNGQVRRAADEDDLRVVAPAPREMLLVTCTEYVHLYERCFLMMYTYMSGVFSNDVHF